MSIPHFCRHQGQTFFPSSRGPPHSLQLDSSKGDVPYRLPHRPNPEPPIVEVGAVRILALIRECVSLLRVDSEGLDLTVVGAAGVLAFLLDDANLPPAAPKTSVERDAVVERRNHSVIIIFTPEFVVNFFHCFRHFLSPCRRSSPPPSHILIWLLPY